MGGEECCPCTLVDRKRKRLINAVDVGVRLHDPTGPSTERTAPPHSAHVPLDDVPRSLDPSPIRIGLGGRAPPQGRCLLSPLGPMKAH